VLIDYEHSMLYLGQKCDAARGDRRAHHTAAPPQMSDDVSLIRLIIAVHLFRVGTQQLLIPARPDLVRPQQIFGCWVVRDHFRARP
jgi:hypothetical protein